MSISETAKVQRNDNTVFRNIEDTGLIMNPDDSSLHTLNEVACFIWDLIVDERTVGEVTAKVHESYNCTPEQAATDVQTFLATLVDRGLVTVSEE
jgi:hypothetical protein